ncbi:MULTISPECIES: PAAR domain-containing protein [Acinetobacter calcoaceticus/baumannii complex]|uniref:PAAR domain-containing protein n=1 Tax=Acinetobacter calcoaceticus/baumannii complex TaxID=909768 RepID=UPI001231149B|nr:MULTISPECIES: PAAR domain-containing protein [Acinetobacter calcoaceticus/baumannii complex]MDH2636152.1 PAAR domain-containing protein [Acinetobacter nosocomialis]
MATPYITIGCPTTGGGKVISGNSLFQIDGIPVACTGDKATCPTHKVLATIVSGDPNMNIFGKMAARAGDSLSCGCKLLPKQNLVVRDNGGGAASSAAKSSPAPVSQKQPAVDSFAKDEYENYYIENSKTTMVPFKPWLFPYDQDKSSLFGQVMQTMSGACTFEVSYKVEKQNLFVTATLLPPALKGDATIYPQAALRLFKDQKPIGDVVRLKVEKGYWNTENDRQPVGSCNVKLPAPDLSVITVQLTMKYDAKFDGGTVVTNPPHVVHEFTITSAARRKK